MFIFSIRKNIIMKKSIILTMIISCFSYHIYTSETKLSIDTELVNAPYNKALKRASPWIGYTIKKRQTESSHRPFFYISSDDESDEEQPYKKRSINQTNSDTFQPQETDHYIIEIAPSPEKGTRSDKRIPKLDLTLCEKEI